MKKLEPYELFDQLKIGEKILISYVGYAKIVSDKNKFIENTKFTRNGKAAIFTKTSLGDKWNSQVMGFWNNIRDNDFVKIETKTKKVKK